MAEIPASSIKSNSNRSKQETKTTHERPKSVVSNRYIPPKRGILGAFIKTDARTIRNYLIKDIIDPKIREFLGTSLYGIINMCLWGDSKSHATTNTMNRPGTPYNSYYHSSKYSVTNNTTSTTNTAPVEKTVDKSPDMDYRAIYIDDRDEANEVCSSLAAIIKEYHAATVADLWSLVNVTADFTDENWGWNELDRIGCVPEMVDGKIRYRIDVPKAHML